MMEQKQLRMKVSEDVWNSTNVDLTFLKTFITGDET